MGPPRGAASQTTRAGPMPSLRTSGSAAPLGERQLQRHLQFVSGLEILNGTYAGFPGIWQVTFVCSDGTRLPTAPASINGHVQNPFLTKLSFPLGMASVSGRSGNWMDQLLVVPDSRNGGGGSWIDQCPDGSLVSGLQAWVTPVNGTAVLGTDCVAGGMRFQCNGTYTSVGEVYGSALLC